MGAPVPTATAASAWLLIHSNLSAHKAALPIQGLLLPAPGMSQECQLALMPVAAAGRSPSLHASGYVLLFVAGRWP
jgi:hypothetical protein